MSELFLDIKTFLNLEKTMSEQQRDLYLRDYHMAFRGSSDNWEVPQSQLEEYRQLEKQAKSKKDGLTVDNFDFTIDVSGTIIIRQGGNVIIVPAEDRLDFQAALFKLPVRGTPPLGPGIANPGQSSAPTNIGNNHLENDDRPLAKERMERNIKEMERWAMASQQYPKTR